MTWMEGAPGAPGTTGPGVTGPGVTGAAGTGGGGAKISLPARRFCLRVVSTARAIVSTNSVTARYTVPLCSTFVVCEPTSWFMVESPNEAPRPSWRGRCMSTMRMRRRQTMTSTTVRISIRMSIRGAEYGGCPSFGKRLLRRFLPGSTLTPEPPPGPFDAERRRRRGPRESGRSSSRKLSSALQSRVNQGG